MSEVPLVDLEVIVRYSLAIRQETAPAEEVLAALDESRAFVLGLLGGSTDNGDEEAGPVHEREVQAGGEWAAEEGDLDADVRAAEDQVALDDLDDSGAEVDDAPGLDPEPPPAERPPVRRARRPAPLPPADLADDRTPLEVEEDEQAWVDEVERIRQRRIRKARREAEERQARQAELAAKVERARLAEQALQAQEARDARRGENGRRGRDGGGAAEAAGEWEAWEERETEAVPPEREAWEEPEDPPGRGRRRTERMIRRARAGEPRPGQVARVPQAPPVDDALELPTPLPPDEAARRREERRRRRAGSGPA